VGALAGLREQGLIRNIGLSNVTVEQFRAARSIVEIAAVTAHYTFDGCGTTGSSDCGDLDDGPRGAELFHGHVG